MAAGGANDVNWSVEQVAATSLMGTHTDGLDHLRIGDRFCNGQRLQEVVEECSAGVVVLSAGAINSAHSPRPPPMSGIPMDSPSAQVRWGTT